MFKVLLIGAGHMGSALLNAWVKNKIYKISVIDPYAKKTKLTKKIKYYKNIDKLKNIKDFDILFFAVTPQIIDEVIEPYKKIILKDQLIISIIAGKKTKYFKNKLGKNIKIIRTMPNLPASVGRGATCLFANNQVKQKDKKYAEQLFKSAGKIYWLKNENNINKITAISGSGPAYYYYFIECLTKAGIKLGLEKNLSYDLSVETALGSLSLLEKSNDNAVSLRKKIAIKGGTTEAAIKKMIVNNKMKKILFNAVNAAFKRANKIGTIKKNKKKYR